MFPHPPYPSNDYVHNDLELGGGCRLSPDASAVRERLVGSRLDEGGMCIRADCSSLGNAQEKLRGMGWRGFGVVVRVCVSGVHVCVYTALYY